MNSGDPHEDDGRESNIAGRVQRFESAFHSDDLAWEAYLQVLFWRGSCPIECENTSPEIAMRSSFVRFAVPFLTLVAMWTDPIAAQLCVGRVASEKAPARIGARYISYPESQNEYGLELGFAPASGLFGSAALAMTTVSQPNGTAKSGELWLGGAVAPKNSPFVVCPLTGLQLTALPTLNDVGVRVTAHTLAYSLGVSAGIPFDATPALQVVPFAGAYFQRQSFTLESTTDNVNNGLYEIGVAVVANRRFSIGPVMRNVFAIERPSRAAYGVVMSYGFGG